MQSDMHYYGVYCLARAAGIKRSSAKVIAYTSQYIDDSVVREIIDHEDGSRVVAVPTAHHPADLKNINNDDQRYIWVPFHFIPGGTGKNFTEKLICRKNSDIAREMVANNINQKNTYILELVGITAHVYADTFAHYGFSGVSSRRNRVDGSTIELLDASQQTQKMLNKKTKTWFEEYGIQGGLLKNVRSFISEAAELASGALGHGGVSIYPDQPYLRWRFEYEYPSDSLPKVSRRDNQETFLEACELLYHMFADFVKLNPEHASKDAKKDFNEMKSIIQNILAFEAGKIDRSNLWREYAAKGFLLKKKERIPVYNSTDWHEEHEQFSKLTNSEDFAKLNIYKFFQAASYHRHYVLRELLPKHGIIVI